MLFWYLVILKWAVLTKSPAEALIRAGSAWLCVCTQLSHPRVETLSFSCIIEDAASVTGCLYICVCVFACVCSM